MVIFKITIVLWVLFFATHYFWKNTMSTADKMLIMMGHKRKLKPIEWALVILLVLSVIASFATLIWFLFWVI